MAVGPSAEAFGRELAAVPGARKQIDRHSEYLTGVVKSLLDRPQDAQAMGRRGREFVEEHYSWDSCLAPLDDLLAGST